MRLSYFVLMCVLTVLDIGLFAVAARHREKKAVKSLLVILVLVIISHMCYGASLVINVPRIKFFVHELKFVGVAFFSVGFYVMYMQIFDRPELTEKRYTIPLSVVPAFFVALAVTNNYHHLFRADFYVVDNAYGSFVGVVNGVMFLPYIIYSYALYIIVMVASFRMFLRLPKMYRLQIGIALFAAVATLFINFVSISGIFFKDFGDATLISFTFAATIQFYALVAYKPARMIGMSRDMAVGEIKDPIIIFDFQDALLDMNTAARDLFGFEPGMSEPEFLKTTLDLTAQEMEDAGGKLTKMCGESLYSIRRTRISDEGGTLLMTMILLRDITELKERELELESKASYDYLTGIANRHAYLRELARLKDGDLPVSIVRFGVSGMKAINIESGHEAGDAVIKSVSGALRDETENGGFCARIGGDEFALLLKNTDERDAQSRADSVRARLPGVKLVTGIAVKRSGMDNISLTDKASMDNMQMNKVKLRSSAGMLSRGGERA